MSRSFKRFWYDNDVWLIPLTVIVSFFIIGITFGLLCAWIEDAEEMKRIKRCADYGYAQKGYTCEDGVLKEKDGEE